MGAGARVRLDLLLDVGPRPWQARQMTIGVTLALVLAASGVAAGDGERVAGKVPESCTLKGKKLHGKVKIVEHFPDFKVKVVEHFPDLKVKIVAHCPDTCGKWQLVEHFPDFTVKLVEHFPDFTILLVEHFPGVP
jgi:hypothetical protein